MSLNQISVFLENKPGTLNRMTHVLADGGINMRAISLAETKDFGIARIIVDDVIAAQNVLKEGDFVSALTPVLAYEIPDEAGGLNTLLMHFTEAKVNIEYMYSCLVDKRAYMVFRVSDPKKAEKALTQKGLRAVEAL
ncbi:MAG: ACT domain-containing protein [bacterium]